VRGSFDYVLFPQDEKMNVLVTDIDGTLTGDCEGLAEFNEYIARNRKYLVLIYATGRDMIEFMNGITLEGLLPPDAAILSTGSEIYINTGGSFLPDLNWRDIMKDSWEKEKIESIMKNVTGAVSQYKSEPFKVCYYAKPGAFGGIQAEIEGKLNDAGLLAKIITSHGIYIDILPYRCDKGAAAEYLTKKMGYKKDQVLVAGDSGNDADLFGKFNRGIVVGNAHDELKDRISGLDMYYAGQSCAAGLLEGLKHYIEG
jgi:sucrose-phosphate synthase